MVHKDKKVEDLISELEPTKEQLEKRANFEREQEALRLSKLEQERAEMRKRQRMLLTDKQRKHAEKLFYHLKGTVSRKEIEDSALDFKNTSYAKLD